MAIQADYPYNYAWLRYAWNKWLAPYLERGVILDVGCGIGVNGALLRSFSNATVIGVDLDTGCLNAARTRGLSVTRGNVCAVPLQPQSVDLVLLTHVIEHFTTAEELLSSIYDVLRPGGAIVVVTPDWARDTGRFYDDPTHRRPYTRESLAHALRDSGFAVRTMRQHNVLRGLGRSSLWRMFPTLCFSGDALFALAERPSAAR